MLFEFLPQATYSLPLLRLRGGEAERTLENPAYSGVGSALSDRSLDDLEDLIQFEKHFIIAKAQNGIATRLQEFLAQRIFLKGIGVNRAIDLYNQRRISAVEIYYESLHSMLTPKLDPQPLVAELFPE
jgi:hypothetical protein